MRARLVRKLLDSIFEMLTKTLSWEKLKLVLDDMIDVFEKHLESEPSMTNRALLTGIGWLREGINLPDDIGGDED